MIVEPDFLGHWKLKALGRKIGKLEALTAVLALWAHCQTRRAVEFDFTGDMLAGICDYDGPDAEGLLTTMVEVRFLDRLPNGRYEVHGWADRNSRLLHNWTQGAKGGRPSKKAENKPCEKPEETQGFQLENPSESQGEPEAEPIRSDKIREESTPVVPKGTPTENAIALAIYNAYPRKSKRPKALEAIEKALKLPGMLELELLKKVKEYATATAKWPEHEQQYIPHPASWFNAQCWLDDPTTWTRYQKPSASENGEKKEGAAPPMAIPEGPEGWQGAMEDLFGAEWRSLYADWPLVPPSDQSAVRRRLKTLAKKEGGAGHE